MEKDNVTKIKVDMIELWQPTCELVWIKECSNPFTTSYTLKQKWFSNKGNSELRDVPIVDDLNNTTNEP